MKTETVIFDTIIPHPAPVNIAELLADIEAVIKRHVILNDHAAAALAVWVLHTYTFELRDTVAYVAIESPEKRCGKTTLLSVLAAMACKSLIASNITVGALFRAIHSCTPTLFIDEADTFLAGNSIMRGIINSGNTRRTAYVLRLANRAARVSKREPLPSEFVAEHASHPHLSCPSAPPTYKTHPIAVPSPLPPAAPKLFCEGGSDGRGDLSRLGSGERNPPEGGGPIGPSERARASQRQGEVRESSTGNLQLLTSSLQTAESTDSGLKKYSCWCPKVIAMIGEVPDTIADRSIVVKMARKLTTEICLPLAALNTAEIKAKCARFALDMGHFISEAPKIHSEGLNDRATDTFDPLFVIARMAGDEWEQKLRAAALGLNSTADTENSGSGLILDIIDVFFQTGREKMFSRDIVARLRDGSMKSQTLKYSSINEYHISKTLRSYGIKPVCLRIGQEVRNGYHSANFREALHRYVSKEDIHTHMDGVRRQCQLRVEARAEAAKQQALVEKFKTAISGDRILSEFEMRELALKIKREEEAREKQMPNVNVNVDT